MVEGISRQIHDSLISCNNIVCLTFEQTWKKARVQAKVVFRKDCVVPLTFKLLQIYKSGTIKAKHADFFTDIFK